MRLNIFFLFLLGLTAVSAFQLQSLDEDQEEEIYKDAPEVLLNDLYRDEIDEALESSDEDSRNSDDDLSDDIEDKSEDNDNYVNEIGNDKHNNEDFEIELSDNVNEVKKDPWGGRRRRRWFRRPRFRIPRFRFPRIRLPRIRLPRIRLPRIRLPRIRLPRIRRIRLQRALRRLTRRFPSLRFRRIIPKRPEPEGPEPPQPTQPPPCRIQFDGCDKSWNTVNAELVPLFTAACQKHDVCYSCKTYRKWSRLQCDDRLKKDMEISCSTTLTNPDEQAFCKEKAKTFYWLTKFKQLKPISSPDWCQDTCVIPAGSPNVALQ